MSNSQFVFSPLGNTVKLTADTIAPAGVSAPVRGSAVDAGQFRIVNSGSETVYLGVGSSATEAQSNADIVVTSQRSIPIMAGSVEIMRFAPGAYFSGITSANPVIIFITPGQGL